MSQECKHHSVLFIGVYLYMNLKVSARETQNRIFRDLLRLRNSTHTLHAPLSCLVMTSGACSSLCIRLLTVTLAGELITDTEQQAALSSMIYEECATATDDASHARNMHQHRIQYLDSVKDIKDAKKDD